MVHPIFTQAETRELLEERAKRQGFRVQYFDRGGLRLVHEHTGEGKFLNNETEAFLMLEGFAWGYRVGGHDGWLAARDSFAPAPVSPQEEDELDLLATLEDESDIIRIDDEDDIILYVDESDRRDLEITIPTNE